MRFAMPTGRSARRAVFAGLSLIVFAAIWSCQAPLEQKRGFVGEPCTGDDQQCRTGLICQQGVCQSVNSSDEVCPLICDKFEECDAGLDGCYRDCMATLREWAEEVTDRYGRCYQSEVSCSDIQSSNAPQNICYAKLELDEARRERCDTLRETATACLNNTGAYDEDQIDNFFDACRRRGRTVNQQRWSNTRQCEDHATADEPRCGQMFRCINTNFQLETDFPVQEPSE